MTTHITPERIAKLLALGGYTPGPWRKDGNGRQVLAPGALICIAPEAAVSKLNTRLIAALPDLHAALAQVNAENERLRAALRDMMSCAHEESWEADLSGPHEDQLKAAMRKARAALNPEGEA